jgi:pimeloyl-ACP methyl ester carboxylesterase
MSLVSLSFIAFSLPPAALPEAPRAAPGVVFVVGGIGGLELFSFNARWVLPAAGVTHAVREFGWTHGSLHFLRDLQDTRHLLGRAEELARQVAAIKERDPRRPVFLVGHSAGAGLVLAAAAMLPPETLERVILLSPAVSPTFDLRPALRATRGEIVSFCSEHDRIVLELGTSLFGTVDRYYGPSAGQCGFRAPADLDADGRALYRRLVQVPWRWEHLLTGRGCGHTSTTAPLFLRHSVAPWLRGEARADAARPAGGEPGE